MRPFNDPHDFEEDGGLEMLAFVIVAALCVATLAVGGYVFVLVGRHVGAW